MRTQNILVYRALFRRGAVLLFGGTALLLGIVMLLLPGPGILMIAAGLGCLSVEFVWARNLLGYLSRLAKKGQRWARERKAKLQLASK